MQTLHPFAQCFDIAYHFVARREWYFGSKLVISATHDNVGRTNTTGAHAHPHFTWRWLWGQKFLHLEYFGTSLPGEYSRAISLIHGAFFHEEKTNADDSSKPGLQPLCLEEPFLFEVFRRGLGQFYFWGRLCEELTFDHHGLSRANFEITPPFSFE